MSCDENTKRRAYYTTVADVMRTANPLGRVLFCNGLCFRRIAIRNGIEPGRKHEINLESLLIRVEEGDVDDGIRLYTALESTKGDGFVLGKSKSCFCDTDFELHLLHLVIITPLQKTWLERYSPRGIARTP